MMKAYFRQLILPALLLSMFATACKKEDSPAADNGIRTGVFSCRYNGMAWESDPAERMVSFSDTLMPSTSVSLSGDTLSVFAFRSKPGDTSLLAMQVLLTPGRTGDYAMSGSEFNMYFFPAIDLWTLLGIAMGYTSSSTLNISKFDDVNKKISGSFNLVMTPKSSGQPILITEGKFTDVAYRN